MWSNPWGRIFLLETRADPPVQGRARPGFGYSEDYRPIGPVRVSPEEVIERYGSWPEFIRRYANGLIGLGIVSDLGRKRKTVRHSALPEAASRMGASGRGGGGFRWPGDGSSKYSYNPNFTPYLV